MPDVTTGEEFVASNLDYLIVGGGTAGLVVAARLSEDSSVTVGVLEAGLYHKDVPQVNIHGMMGSGLMNPDLDWIYFTEPQKYLGNKTIYHPRGKGLGGTSSLNFLVLTRPSKSETDSWETLGIPGWNWDSIFSYMKKSEQLDPVKLSKETAYRYGAVPDPVEHGTTGPIHHSYPPYVTEVHEALLDSFGTLGLPRINDSHTGYPVGAFLGTNAVDSRTATRSYAASAYYAPNISRPNFLVLTGAQATKINLESVGGLQRAVSVDFVKDGKPFTATARKEIIMSAGSLQTPQLLELSGIGDRDILSAHGIGTKIDLPGVGDNLQDHGFVPWIVQADNGLDTIENLNDPDELLKHQALYAERKGLLAGFDSSFLAFGSASLATLEASASDVFASTKREVKKGIQAGYDAMRTFIDDPNTPTVQILFFNGHFPIQGMTIDPKKRYLTMLNVYSHPFARGTVHIKSTDPFAPPAINPNYFSNPADFEILVRTMQMTQKLMKTSPFKDLIVEHVVPSADSTEEELKEFIKVSMSTLFHPSGTAAMLPMESGGVVDPKLLVYGTSNLRVIDCSVVPLLFSANPQTVVYAIAEKGADIIKGVI